jgi:hypothetical protein
MQRSAWATEGPLPFLVASTRSPLSLASVELDKRSYEDDNQSSWPLPLEFAMPKCVCVGCGCRQGWNDDWGVVGPYSHCGDHDCRDAAYGMLEEDRLAGLTSPYDEEPLLAFPGCLDRAA